MKKVKIIFTTILVTVIMFGIFKNQFGQGNNENLATLINNGAFLVDVRTPDEFSGGSVKGAVNIPLNVLPNQLAKFENKQNIIVFCQSGGRSGQAKNILEKNGFDNITNGGGWKSVSRYVSE
ncbi:MAG: rhodanese-like domain-containing protein [Candidatus Kapaibacteriales bacterium]